MHDGLPAQSDLVYFLESANQQNLSQAAKKLGLSQPSLSLAIKRIEKSIGADVFVRHKKGVNLTLAGQTLLQHVRQLLEQWDLIKLKTMEANHDVKGSFTVGCHPSVALYTLPRFLNKLIKDYPQLQIKLHHGLSRHITEDVCHFKTDIGIVINPIRYQDLIIQKLASDKVTLWRNHEETEVHELHSGRGVLLCDPSLIQTQTIMKSFKKNKIQFKRVITSDSLEVLSALTKTGCGVGVLPERVAKHQNLIAIKKSPFYQDELCLLYRGENRNIKALKIIAEAIKEAFAKDC